MKYACGCEIKVGELGDVHVFPCWEHNINKDEIQNFPYNMAETLLFVIGMEEHLYIQFPQRIHEPYGIFDFHLAAVKS